MKRHDPKEPPQRRGWWTPRTRVALIVFATVGLVVLAANIAVITRTTGWTAIRTVDLLVAAVYAAVVVRAVGTPAGKDRRR